MRTDFVGLRPLRGSKAQRGGGDTSSCVVLTRDLHSANTNSSSENGKCTFVYVGFVLLNLMGVLHIKFLLLEYLLVIFAMT